MHHLVHMGGSIKIPDIKVSVNAGKKKMSTTAPRFSIGTPDYMSFCHAALVKAIVVCVEARTGISIGWQGAVIVREPLSSGPMVAHEPGANHHSTF